MQTGKQNHTRRRGGERRASLPLRHLPPARPGKAHAPCALRRWRYSPQHRTTQNTQNNTRAGGRVPKSAARVAPRRSSCGLRKGLTRRSLLKHAPFLERISLHACMPKLATRSYPHMPHLLSRNSRGRVEPTSVDPSRSASPLPFPSHDFIVNNKLNLASGASARSADACHPSRWTVSS